MIASGADLGPVREQYLQAVLSPGATNAMAVIDRALSEHDDPATIYLEVLAPAMVRVGELWAEARISVAQEHVATALTSAVMARLSQRFAQAPARPRTVVLSCPGDELHALGLRMVADFLEADGWQVRYVGAATPAPDLVALVQAERAEVVGVSTALSLHLEATRATVQALSECDPRPFIVVGGAAYAGDEALAAAMQADAFAGDPLTLIRLLQDRFPVVSPPTFPDVLNDSVDIPLAELDDEGIVARANLAFRRLIDGDPVARRIHDFVAAQQHNAVSRFLEAAGPEWSRLTVGLQSDPRAVVRDQLFLVRRVSAGYELVVGSYDAGDQWLAMLAFADELIKTQRSLSHANRLLQRARDEADAARTVAEAATATRDEFLSMVSHEVRTPLTSVIGFASRLTRQRDLPAATLDQLEIIAREARRSARMIEQLLEVSRIEAGELTTRMTAVDLRAVLSGAVASLGARHPAVQLALELPAALPGIISDEDRITEIVTNLLENAARYAGETPRVTLRVRVDEDQVYVDVEDDGPGIPPEARAEIFERGHRRQSSGGGLGLGLYLSRAVAEALGGTLAVHTAPAGGARFVLALPRAAEGANGD